MIDFGKEGHPVRLFQVFALQFEIGLIQNVILHQPDFKIQLHVFATFSTNALKSALVIGTFMVSLLPCFDLQKPMIHDDTYFCRNKMTLLILVSEMIMRRKHPLSFCVICDEKIAEKRRVNIASFRTTSLP